MASKQRTGYKLATYRSKNGPRAALIVEDRVFDAAAQQATPPMPR
jgi:hypothetical protein